MGKKIDPDGNRTSGQSSQSQGSQRQGRKGLPIRKKLSFTGFLVACVLLGSELGLRLWDSATGGDDETNLSEGPPQPTPPYLGPPQPEPQGYFAICDRYLGYRNRPHGVYQWWRMEGQPVVTTDEFGYRNGYGWTAEGESPIVLFLGDSFTFCAEVNDDRTGPSEVAKVLEASLGDDIRVRVLNAGVRSYSTLQSKRMMIECFDRFPSIKVVVYTYCANDIVENIVPNYSLPIKRPLMVRRPQTGEFQETDVTDPAVPWGASFLNWRPPPEPPPGALAEAAAFLDRWSVLFHRCRSGWRRIDRQWLCGSKLPSDNRPIPLEEFAYWQQWAFRNGGRKVVQQILAEMEQICTDHNAAFLVTQAAYNEENIPEAPHFPGDCTAAGRQFYSLDEQFEPDARPYLARYANGQWQGHFNTRGTRAFARVLAPVIERALRSQPQQKERNGATARPVN